MSSLFAFWHRRLAIAASIPANTPPVFEFAPFASSAFIGKAIGVIDGVLAAGTTGAITTEVVKFDGSVVPASYIIQQGDQLRIRQTAQNASGVDVHFSGWVFAQQEITGYTDVTPTMRDAGIALTAVNQPGSRIHYAASSSALTPSESDFYFLTPSGLVDSSGSLTGAGGVPYGADWRNPSGPIKPYRHLSACLPTNGGTAPGVRTGGGYIGNVNTTEPRVGKPDIWALKRGDVFNHSTDLAEYQVFCPTYTPLNGLFIGINTGASASSRRVMCDYGPSNLPRPQIISPHNRNPGADTANSEFFLMNGVPKHVRFVGIHYNGQVRDPGFVGKVSITGSNAAPADRIEIGWEDCLLDGMGFGDITALQGKSQAFLYDCTLVDAWTSTRSTSHISGIHSDASDPGRMQIVKCRIGRNGFIGVNPALVEGGTYTPPAHNPANAYVRDDLVLSGGEWYVLNATSIAAGTAITNAAWVRVTDQGGRRAYASIFDRNLYLAGPSDMYDSIVLRGGSGEQFRSGGWIRRNFIQAGYLLVSSWVAPSEDELQTALVDWNVLQNVNQTGVHTGENISVQLGARFSLVDSNVWTGAAEEGNGAGVTMKSRGDTNDPQKTAIYNRTRGNVFRRNLFAVGSGIAFRLIDGLWTINAQDATFAVMPSLTENQFANNDVITTSTIAPTYTRGTVAPLAPATTDSVFTGTTAYASRAAYAAAKGGADPTRTLKTYLQSLGITVNSIDGVHELIEIWRTIDRYNSPVQYTAKAINNYIRAGLGAPLQA